MRDDWIYTLRFAGREARLEPGTATIGRGPTNDVVLPHESVSRQHASLVVGDAGILVEDLGSGNGTYADGRRVTGPVTVHNGATLVFGEFAIGVQILPAPFSSQEPEEHEPGEATMFLQRASMELAIGLDGEEVPERPTMVGLPPVANPRSPARPWWRRLFGSGRS